MNKQLGYIGIDQYGNHYKIDKHPRKELLQHLGATKAHKMFNDTKNGQKEIGYVIKNMWVRVYRILEWK